MTIYDNRLLFRSLSIPREIREDLAEVVNRNRGKIYFPQPDLHYMFEVYNRYIAPDYAQESIKCGRCRMVVVQKLRIFINNWEEHGFEDPKQEPQNQD